MFEYSQIGRHVGVRVPHLGGLHTGASHADSGTQKHGKGESPFLTKIFIKYE